VQVDKCSFEACGDCCVLNCSVNLPVQMCKQPASLIFTPGIDRAGKCVRDEDTWMRSRLTF
jgi:hypothetical protein